MKTTEDRFQDRSGVSAVLIVAMLFVFVVCAGLTVDIAYMQLVRTELRAATDAAAKAASEALARTEDQSAAIAEARRYASLNSVGGRSFRIRDRDVEFGRVAPNRNGKYVFSLGGSPSNAVRVRGGVGDNSLTSAIPLFFAKSLGHDDFATSHSATACQQDVEVCLALDRSGSMLFDMSGRDYSYPADNPLLSSWASWGSLWRNHLSPPNPVGSRWAVMAGAVDLFLEEAGKFDSPPHVGMVSWASNYTMPVPPRIAYAASHVDVALPVRGLSNWRLSAKAVEDAIAARSAMPMMGGTDMAAGIDAAAVALTDSHTSSLSNKVIILLSDGIWNGARNPIQAAKDASAAGITIHSISMLSTDQATLRAVARIGGGRFYSANSEVELRSAFAELARTLPVVLTE